MAGKRTCCCGSCSARTGTIIIAVIWTLLGAYNTLVSCSHLMVLTDDEGKHDLSELVSVYRDNEIKTSILNLYVNYRTLTIVATCLVLLGELINVPLSGYLLLGAVKNGPAKRVVPWLWFNGFSVGVSILSSSCFTLYMASRSGGGLVTTLIICLVVVHGFYYYLLRVVYYFMEEVEQRERGGADEFNGVVVGFVSVAPPNVQQKAFYI